MRKRNDMIFIVGLDAEDLEGMATAIAMSNCRSRVTRDPGAVEDGAGGMLPDSISIMVRPDE
jgi:hypothetical protein